MNGESVTTRFVIEHRISIEVDLPSQKDRDRRRGSKDISNSDIHKYRMHTTPEEILSVQSDFNERDIKSGQRKAALAYHPDKHNIEDELLEQIAKRRMQEVNEAYDYLRSILEKRKSQ